MAKNDIQLMKISNSYFKLLYRIAKHIVLPILKIARFISGYRTSKNAIRNIINHFV